MLESSQLLRYICQMQAAGSPPNDLVGDLNEGADALGSLDAACPQQ